MRIFRDIGDQYHLADSLANLGDAQRDAGQHAAAARSWREALDILDGMSHPAADRIRDSLRALG